MGKIVCLQALSPEQESLIQKTAPGYEIIQGKAKEIDPAIVRQAEILLGWSKLLEEPALHAESPLRWVQVRSAGIDMLPLERLEQKSVLLTNASGVHAIPITEMIFGFLLSHTRYLHTAGKQQLQQIWKKPANNTLGELHGQTMLIVGVGEIGSETARIAKAFGMRVTGIRRSGRNLPYVDHMYTMDGLQQAVADADIVVNILPATDETLHIFDEKLFAAFKPGMFFVNVGRGQTVNTDALVQSLENGQVAFAGLDVFEEEPLPAGHPLWAMENVLITPHIAGDTERYDGRVFDIFLENLKAYAAGHELPRNRVDYKIKY
ncbi:D-2-hydroxyacid dehydrogenase [Paenibacillus sp. P96]|uniref:D-2-hydroxyacid dehydrogenase n=1 Tax=Paenibacillus zeirhizosphaerae TaxID=2987519 RepID=A0ABT9FW60_9BACL|nr:D-2-hydroxyacid dehydrogenase [Paenibacillus sp. P96]MDP4098968.1 D-2-hydroxyacid dehydrogenase [Paenibacillus sp. P96]